MLASYYRILSRNGTIAVGLEDVPSNALVGFVCSFPSSFSAHGISLDAVEANFLCVSHEYRSRGLAPLLINEITRLNNLNGIFSAIFTSGTLIGQPFARAQYFHLPLNYTKLKLCGFIDDKIPQAHRKCSSYSTLKLKSLFDCTETIQRDICTKLQTQYKTSYDMFANYSWDAFSNVFISGSKLKTFVGLNDDESISSVISYYVIDSKILENESVSKISCAYIFHNIAENANALCSIFSQLIDIFSQSGIDVINCLNTMNNMILIEEFGFKPGDGYLNYYFYNWKTSHIPLDKLAYAVF